MKIIVFAHALRASGGRSVGINTLNSIQKVNIKNEYLFVVPDQPEYHGLNLENEKCQVYYCSLKMGRLGRIFFDYFTIKKILQIHKPDVIWCMGNLGLRDPSCPQAVTLHSPYFVYNIHNCYQPTRMDRIQIYIMKFLFQRSLNSVDLFFCQTNTMERRLRETYGYTGRVSIIPNLVSKYSKTGKQIEIPEPLRSYKNKFKMLYVTHYYIHKGIEALVDLIERFPEDFSDSLLVLTIEEGQHKNANNLIRRISNEKFKDKIICVGSLKQSELSDYYQNCDCLVMPTKMESFSGTYLEAMHFGLPIITSDLDFAREVCGDAAVYFDPWDSTSIKDAILNLKSSSTLRNDLIQKGKSQLSGFEGKTWDDNTKLIITELVDLVEKRPN